MLLLDYKPRLLRRITFAIALLAPLTALPAFAQFQGVPAPRNSAPQQSAPAQAPASSSGGSGAAGNAMAIAAVVNEDIITVFDVQSRVAMFIATSGLENTPDMQRRLLPQVVQALVDERLKLQEAKRLKIETTDAEVRQAVDLIEQQNGMQPGTFRQMLNERGVDMGALYGQIEADVAWLKVVRQELRRDVNIAPEEVQSVMARLKANQGKPENQVSEIFLPINVNARDADVRALADRLVQQARGGTPFAALAQQFSQSPTAALGGDLGWVVRGELEEEVDAAIARMEPNEISDPIRATAGYHIIQLKARRDSGAADPLMAVITMSQLYIPTVGGRAPDAAKLREITEAVSTKVGNCDQMNELAKTMGGPGSGPLEPLRIGMLPDAVRDAVMKLPPDRVSPPIDVKGARIFAILCTRQDDSGLPSEEQVYGKLENDKLENVARQRLRDLRRQALIDIRL
jgi:peptidyl-prolyl cis-trans isomerase SurA